MCRSKWRIIYSSLVIAIASIVISGCAMLPGFGITEQPLLYYLPVSEVAKQVSCELQDFVDDYIDEHTLIKDPKTGTVTRIDSFLKKHRKDPEMPPELGEIKRRWLPSTADAEVTLKLQTDDGGYVNFTGVKAAELGLAPLTQLITVTGSGATAVPSLAAKVSPKRTRTVTIKFTVPVNSPLPVTSEDGDKVRSHCPPWAQSYAKHLFLKDWLKNYFETINKTEAAETTVKSIKRSNDAKDKCYHDALIASGFKPKDAPFVKEFDGDKYIYRANSNPATASLDPCISNDVKFTSVELNSQLVISVDLSAGATPTFLGNGAVFILPISGLGLDINPDYQHSIDITLNMCDDNKKDPDTESPCAPPNTKTRLVQWSPMFEQQCHLFALLSPVSTGMKAPKDVADVHNTPLTCDGHQGCYVKKADYDAGTRPRPGCAPHTPRPNQPPM